jgi:hypothetical protein
MTGQARIARWSCTPGEWERFIQIERKYSGIKKWAMWLIILTPMLVAVVAVVAVLRQPGPSMGVAGWADLIGVIVFTLGFIFGIVWLAQYLRTRALRSAKNHVVCIGTRGVVLGGRFNSFEQLGAELEQVKYEAGDPGVMVFRWLQPAAGAYGLPADMAVTVPVPKGSDAEAHRVIESFRNQFKPPKADIS